MKSAILAIDQGTTGSTALVLSLDGRVLGRASCEFTQYFPRPGWVEHDLDELWASVLEAVRSAVRDAGIPPGQIACVGITNQRETTCLWERTSGRPVNRAIVWQDRRTAPLCERLRADGQEPTITEVTGLLLDPYFSATKLHWMLEHLPGVVQAAGRGELCFGTVDTYLLWRMTGGPAGGVHATDVSNASRTLLMDLKARCWSQPMLQLFEVPESLLAEIRPSASQFGRTRGFEGLPDGVPITGIAGDQHAALFGQTCFEPGDAKCTYGTGAFVLVNTGQEVVKSSTRMLSTMAWQIGETPTYALEGACFVAGAAVQWLRDGLGIIDSSAEVEALAGQVATSAGVVFVPALSGLGAPYWDPEARGLLCGITRGTQRAHIARATLEAIAFQVGDVIRPMSQDLGVPITRIRVDGGAAANDLLMQLQAELGGVVVERPSELETTAYGAAMLAGIGEGFFNSPSDAAKMTRLERRFDVSMNDEQRSAAQRDWTTAVRRTLMGYEATPK